MDESLNIQTKYVQLFSENLNLLTFWDLSEMSHFLPMIRRFHLEIKFNIPVR